MTSPTSMTTPCPSGNCEEDNAKELEKKTADLKQDKVSDTCTTKDPQVTTPNCDEDNAKMNLSYYLKMEKFEKKTKDLRNANSELEDRVKSLQSQVKDLVRRST